MSTLKFTRLRGVRSLRLALVVAVLSALGLLWLVDHSFQRLVETNVERQEFQQARVTVNGLMNSLMMAESSAHGYMRNGGAEDHARFNDAAERVTDLFGQLDRTVAKTSLPDAATRDFKTQLKRKLDVLALSVKLRGNGQTSTADQVANSKASTDRTRQLDDTATKLISRIDAQAAIKQAQFQQLVNYSRLAFLASVLALLCGFVIYIRQRVRLRAADVREHQMLQSERDRLEVQVQERTRELETLATYLQRAVEDERARLARELHDELGALMTTAKLDIARMRSRLPAVDGVDDLRVRLQHLNATLGEAIALKRRIMGDLYPTALHNLGLVAALESLVRKFRERSKMTLVTSLEAVELGAEGQLTVYRMVQEALTNIAKYAHAKSARVEMRQDRQTIRIVVADDGDGFDPSRLAREAHGLAGMRHRLRSCGGVLEIESAPGHGTQLAARIPRQQ
jgi:signal transduction histidine kinase